MRDQNGMSLAAAVTPATSSDESKGETQRDPTDLYESWIQSGFDLVRRQRLQTLVGARRSAAPRRPLGAAPRDAHPRLARGTDQAFDAVQPPDAADAASGGDDDSSV